MKAPPKATQGSKKPAPKQQGLWVMKYPLLILAVAVMLVYLPTVRLGFTELDDSIFIREQKAFNEDLGNLVVSFKRGVFNPTEDVYYRPLLLDSFILNYQLSGENIAGWHLVNVLLHLAAVLLLFLLLRKLEVAGLTAFLLSLLFAVHPVLSQAVAWIPGRNDTLLAVFVFSFLISVLNYSFGGKLKWLGAQVLFLACALFTKETAVFAAPAAWLLLLLMRKSGVFDASMWRMYVAWLIAGVIWFVARSMATLEHDQLQPLEMMQTFPTRAIVLIHYLGKIFLPVNLSVFPIIEDTSAIYGLIATALLAVLIYFTEKKNRNVIYAGLVVYVLFFIPALLVPASLNDQDFEHRTYLPMLGILLILSETALFRNRLKQEHVLYAGIALCIVLAIVNLRHQKKFSDPVTFWTAAVSSSPNSAYANMMLGARIDDLDRLRSEELIRKSYAMDSAAKYINYYMGVMLQQHDSILASEKFFMKEVKKTDYYMCYFHLARVDFERGDKPAAINYLEAFISRVPDDPQANNNLLLLYMETGETQKALGVIARMKNFGLQVPSGVEDT